MSGGVARANLDTMIPWLVEADFAPLVVHDAQRNVKEMKNMAEVACNCAAAAGVTELSMLDHDLKQQVATKEECSVVTLSSTRRMGPKQRLHSVMTSRLRPKSTPSSRSCSGNPTTK